MDIALMFPHGVTVTVHRPGGEDRYGNPLPGAEHDVDGCGVAPAGTSDEAVHRASTVEWDLDLLAPYSADIKSADEVTIPGEFDDAGNLVTFQVHGRPRRFRSPFTGWEAGMVVRLKAATG